METQAAQRRETYPSLKYIAPFVVFLVFLSFGPNGQLNSVWGAPLRVLIMAGICVVCWPRELPLCPWRPLASATVGALVFFIWIAPDVFVSGYRESPIFSNRIMGHVHSSLPTNFVHSPWLLTWRTIRAVIVVPVIEELFWRAWLMRWLIKTNFQSVPLGSYTPLSFWFTAILFASEHGPYWDVGLLTGIIYNFWMIRSKSVTSCILMHAVTNGMLSAYIVATAQWQYWL